MKESHGYRFVTRVSNPTEFYESAKPFLVKNFKEKDKAKNCVYKTKHMTIVLCLVGGRITIHTDLYKNKTIKRLKELFPQYFKELVKNLRLNKKEVRRHGTVDTEGGYTDYHDYPHPTPSSSPVLQKKIDEKDIMLLSAVLGENSLRTGQYSRFGMRYMTFKRRLDKLAVLRFLEKIGKSPALYSVSSNADRLHLIKEFVALWRKLFHSTPPM